MSDLYQLVRFLVVILIVIQKLFKQIFCSMKTERERDSCNQISHVLALEGWRQGRQRFPRKPGFFSGQVQSWKTPSRWAWGDQVLGMWYFSFSALTLLVGWQEGHPACKTLGVGLLVVRIWLELCTYYSSSCHHHFSSSLSSIKPGNQGSPGKIAVNAEGGGSCKKFAFSTTNNDHIACGVMSRAAWAEIWSLQDS